MLLKQLMFYFYVWIDYFHHICENFTDIRKIENVYAKKTELILKNLNDVITSRQDVFINKTARHISCAVDVSLWVKLSGHTLYRAKVKQVYIL